MPVRLPIEPSDPPDPHFDVSCALAGVQYRLEFRWNSRAASWYMDVYTETGTPIRTGIRVALGIPLGRRSVDAAFPAGVFIAHDTSGKEREAGFGDLGARVEIYFYTFDEFGAL
jgi:hypothetical protein